MRSVTQDRRTSRDAACTMIIGRDTSHMGPSALKAYSLTCSSAVISWLPANSNHQHVVRVNNVKYCEVKPGVFRQQITGMFLHSKKPTNCTTAFSCFHCTNKFYYICQQACRPALNIASPCVPNTCALPAKHHRQPHRHRKRHPEPTPISAHWPRICPIRHK